MNILTITLVFYTAVFSALISEEGFENDSAFYAFRVAGNGSAVIDTTDVYAGAGSVKLDVSRGPVRLSKRLFLHKSSDELKNGMYLRYYFKAMYDSAALRNNNSDIVALFFNYELQGKTGTGFGTPFLGLRWHDGSYTITSGLRDTMKASPVFYDGPLHAPAILSNTWHCIEFYFALKDGAIVDSLFVDNKLAAVQHVPMKEEIETCLSLLLGTWGWGDSTNISSLHYDDLKISCSRIGPQPSKPDIVHPVDGHTFVDTQPVFTVATNSLIESVRLIVLGDSADMRDSVFDAKAVLRFPKPFIPDRLYTVTAQTKTVYGLWSESVAHLFLVKPDPFPMREPRSFSVACGHPDQNKTTFASGDTVLLYLRNSSGIKMGNIDVNLSAGGFVGDIDKQWYLADQTANWVFSLSLEKKPQLYSIFGKEVFLVNPDSGEPVFPLSSLPLAKNWSDRIVYSDTFSVLPIVLKDFMVLGTWHVTARFDEPDKKNHYAASCFFQIVPPSKKHQHVTIIALVVGLVLVSGIVFLLRAKQQPVKVTNAMKEVAAKITRFLENNYQKSLSNDEIGAHTGLSAHRASEVFKQVTGSTPVAALNTIRIEHAKELLKTTGLPVSDIAYSVGFSDPRVFQNNFKKMENLTPGEFRAKNA